MTDCIDTSISVATIYSPAKKRYLPHIVRWNNKQMRVTEASFRQQLDYDKNLVNIYEVVADSGLQLTLFLDATTQKWSIDATHYLIP